MSTTRQPFAFDWLFERVFIASGEDTTIVDALTSPFCGQAQAPSTRNWRDRLKNHRVAVLSEQ